ncbi:hypothetical protein OG698_45060 [Streptomyces sp. NBC_01003]|uniref:hypothetical protein n=1 Tax=Streptomyces sp. NBC_01003 TaxID=2903714 RepID=UPI003863EE7E|nr:hypothetical protein OG698_45060 [Streptomyces sp. NBC_01003]
MRAHVLEACPQLVADHGLDGLKLDFLDDATVYAADGGDPVGPAMAPCSGTCVPPSARRARAARRSNCASPVSAPA